MQIYSILTKRNYLLDKLITFNVIQVITRYIIQQKKKGRKKIPSNTLFQNTP